MYRYGDSGQPWRVPLAIITGRNSIPLILILADGALYKAIIFCINSSGRPTCFKDVVFIMNYLDKLSAATVTEHSRIINDGRGGEGVVGSWGNQ